MKERKKVTDPEARRVMEKEALTTMVGIYCHGKHRTRKGELCPSCREFLDYALMRTDKCPFMATKSFCSACKVHCYNKQWRPYVKEVMGYAGPRMLFHNPLLAVKHMSVSIRQKLRQNKETSA